MRTRVRNAAVMCLVLLCAAAVFAEELRPMRVAAIKATPRFNEVVRVDGFVTQFVDGHATSTSFFYLKDDWGGVIKVRTSKEAPSVGKRYTVQGPLGLDPYTKDVYISEEVRTEIAKYVEPVITIVQQQAVSPPARPGSEVPTETTATQPTATQPQANTNAGVTAPAKSAEVVATTPTKPETSFPWLYVLIGGAVVVILLVAVVLMLRSRREDATAEYPSITTATHVEPPPPPEQVIEGKTIKLHAPPPNTVKLLPGWFEVVSGDDVVKQIRFYNLGGDRGNETTFGRASGRPYAHIQLKAPTVSSRQAKVWFDNGTPKLMNFASTDSNPTRVNGRELGVNEAVVLTDSDRVEMGEVSLLFHGTPTLAHTGNA